jgi:hypothetical protein
MPGLPSITGFTGQEPWLTGRHIILDFAASNVKNINIRS